MSVDDKEFDAALDNAEADAGESDTPIDIMSEPGAVGAALKDIQKEGVKGQLFEMEADHDEELRQQIATLRPWQRSYVAALRLKGNPSLAGRAAGVSSVTVKKFRDKDPIFNALCDEAMTFNDDMVEARGYQLAVEGYYEPVFQGGMKVGHKHVFSEKLLEVMLKARKPGKFAPEKKMNVNLTGPGADGKTLGVAQVAELVRNLSPTLAAGVLASRPKTIDVKVEEIKKA